MRSVRAPMLAVVSSALLLTAGAAGAGFGDAMKKKGCEVSCDQAKEECIDECKGHVDKAACKLACEEGETPCVEECVEA